MRPIKLVISAFGPYKDEIVLDMDKLGKSGIYLITGDTGAGKTTVFDAICFALYGDASGDIRQTNMLRSKYADKKTPTFVQMIFEYGGKLYDIKRNPEYMREKDRGEGLTKQTANATLILPDGSVVTKVNEVKEKIEEILGVDRTQFSQIAMIAQGDFRKLLDCDTNTRKDIFRKIFKTDAYKKFEDKIKQQFADLCNEREIEKQASLQYINQLLCDENSVFAYDIQRAKNGELLIEDVISLAEEIINNDIQDKNVIDKKLDEITKKAADINSKITIENSRINTKNEYQNIEEQIKKAQIEFDQTSVLLESAKKKDNESDNISKRINLIEEKMPKFDELESLATVLKDKENELDNAKKEIQTAKEKLNELEKDLDKTEQEQEKIKNSSLLVQQYETKLNELETKKSTIIELENSIKKYEEQKNNYNILNQNTAKAIDEWNKADKSYNEKNIAFLTAQAGIMASKLNDGIPCPVCGSTNHPNLAVLSDNSPSEEDVKLAKNKADIANEKANRLSQESASQKSIVNTLWDNINEKGKKLFGSNENIKENSQSYYKSICEEIEDSKKSLKEAKQNKKQLELIEKKLPNLREEITNTKNDISKIDANISAITATVTEKKSTIKNLKSELDFESKADALTELNELKLTLNQIKTEYEKHHKSFEKLNLDLSSLNGKKAALKQTLSESKDYDKKALERELKELSDNQKQLDLKKQQLFSRIKLNSDLKESIIKNSQKLSSLDKKYISLSALSNTANGKVKDKEKITLETFVQMKYFDAIISKANARLLKMTDGQYELTRRNEAQNKRSQAGLDLDVLDHYNGTSRSVSTLSGGESFMASLSLALGLSDEIQSSNGGIQLDTMFVDEGFGSLDSAALDRALNALISLSQGNRLVGIISHVDALADRIDNKIIVTKQRENGSFAKIVTE